MRQKLRLTGAALAFAFTFLLVAGGAPVLLAQRTAFQGVVTPDDPIWGAQDAPEPPPQEPAPAAEPAAQEAGGGRGRAGSGAPGPRPYAQVVTSEARADEGIFRVHRIREQLVAAMPAAIDRASRAHLEDARDQIDEMLDPRAMRAPAGRGAGPGGAPALRFDFDNDPFLKAPDGCWPDYVI